MEPQEIIQEFANLGDRLLSQIAQPTPLTLGGLIMELEIAIAQSDDGPDQYISFDFGAAHPTGFNSFRRQPRHLCLEYSGEYRTEIYAGKFLEICKKADGATFYMWKGGDCYGDRNSEIYVACAGCGSNTRVIGVRESLYGAGLEIVTVRMEHDY